MACKYLAVGIDDGDNRDGRVEHRSHVIGEDAELLSARTVQ